MARTERPEESEVIREGNHGHPRLLLWVAASALIVIGIALFLIAFFRQGIYDALFYLIVIAMGVYLLTIPWRNRRAQAKSQASAKR